MVLMVLTLIWVGFSLLNTYLLFKIASNSGIFEVALTNRDLLGLVFLILIGPVSTGPCVWVYRYFKVKEK